MGVKAKSTRLRVKLKGMVPGSAKLQGASVRLLQWAPCWLTFVTWLSRCFSGYVVWVCAAFNLGVFITDLKLHSLSHCFVSYRFFLKTLKLLFYFVWFCSISMARNIKWNWSSFQQLFYKSPLCLNAAMCLKILAKMFLKFTFLRHLFEQFDLTVIGPGTETW